MGQFFSVLLYNPFKRALAPNSDNELPAYLTSEEFERMLKTHCEEMKASLAATRRLQQHLDEGHATECLMPTIVEHSGHQATLDPVPTIVEPQTHLASHVKSSMTTLNEAETHPHLELKSAVNEHDNAVSNPPSRVESAPANLVFALFVQAVTPGTHADSQTAGHDDAANVPFVSTRMNF